MPVGRYHRPDPFMQNRVSNARICVAWAGMKEWAPRGPNKGVEAKEQTKLQKPGHPDP